MSFRRGVLAFSMTRRASPSRFELPVHVRLPAVHLGAHVGREVRVLEQPVDGRLLADEVVGDLAQRVVVEAEALLDVVVEDVDAGARVPTEPGQVHADAVAVVQVVELVERALVGQPAAFAGEADVVAHEDADAVLVGLARERHVLRLALRRGEPHGHRVLRPPVVRDRHGDLERLAERHRADRALAGHDDDVRVVRVLRSGGRHQARQREDAGRGQPAREGGHRSCSFPAI